MAVHSDAIAIVHAWSNQSAKQLGGRSIWYKLSLGTNNNLLLMFYWLLSTCCYCLN